MEGTATVLKFGDLRFLLANVSTRCGCSPTCACDLWCSLGPQEGLDFLRAITATFSLTIDEAAVKRHHGCLKYFCCFWHLDHHVSMFSFSGLFSENFSLKNFFLSVFGSPVKVKGSRRVWAMSHGHIFLTPAVAVDVCISHSALPLGTRSQYIRFSLTLLSCLQTIWNLFRGHVEMQQ